jgi:hypothetical protein
VLTVYFDESYNHRTMCIGGWLCRDDVWAHIEKDWLTRINYERALSAKKGLKSLSRYHASNCASLVGEFEGWPVSRQILLTKKLLAILKKYRPVGFAAGLSFDELIAAFPALKKKKDIKWEAYKLCMQECVAKIGHFMEEEFPGDKVNIIHDRGDCDSAAKSAFDDLLATTIPYKKHFVGVMAGSWEDFIALQAADWIAFEGFKMTDARKRGKFDLRKSLQAIVGHQIPIRAGYFQADGLRNLADKGMGLSKLGFIP